VHTCLGDVVVVVVVVVVRDAFLWLASKCEIKNLSIRRRIHVSFFAYAWYFFGYLGFSGQSVAILDMYA